MTQTQLFTSKHLLTMDSFSDPTLLPDGVVREIVNLIPDKRALITRKGLTRYNATSISSTTGITGNSLHITPSNVEVELAASDGKLFAGVGGSFTEVYSNLSPSTPTLMSQFKDVTLIADGVSPLLVYRYGEEPFPAGIPSPKTHILIEGCESLSTWTVSGGSAALNKNRSFQGEASIDLTSGVGATLIASSQLPAPLNLDTYPDGSTSKTTDYISLYLLRGYPDSFNSCTLILSTDTSFSNYFQIALHTLSEWVSELRPYVIFNLQIRRSAFTTVGSPTWSTIRAVRLVAEARPGYSVFMTVDFIRAEKTGPTAASTGVSGNLNGYYSYMVTYENEEGEESDPSYPSAPIAVVNGQIQLTNIPISGSRRVIRRNIYRVGGTSNLWKLVVSLEDNVQTSFTDNIPENLLTIELNQVTGTPYIPKTITVSDNFVVLANLTTPDSSSTFPNGVMVSEEGSFDVFNHLNFFEIEPDSSDTICWLCSFLGHVYVGKGRSIWRFSPQNLDQPPTLETRIYGGVGPMAVTTGENEFYFLDRTGVISYNGSSFEVISDPEPGGGRLGSVRNHILNIPKEHIHKSWLIYHDRTLLVGIPSPGSTTPNLILAYYTPTRTWFIINNWNISCGYSTRTPSSGHLLRLGSATSGYVFNGFSGDSDDGAPIESSINFQDSDFGQLELKKDFSKFILHCSKLSSEDPDVPIELYPRLDLKDILRDTNVVTILGEQVITEALEDVIITAGLASTISNHPAQRLDIPSAQLGSFGHFLGTQLVARGRFLFRGVSFVVRFLEPTF